MFGITVHNRHAAVREKQVAAAKARGVTVVGGARKIGKTRTGWHGALLLFSFPLLMCGVDKQCISIKIDVHMIRYNLLARCKMTTY